MTKLYRFIPIYTKNELAFCFWDVIIYNGNIEYIVGCSERSGFFVYMSKAYTENSDCNATRSQPVTAAYGSAK